MIQCGEVRPCPNSTGPRDGDAEATSLAQQLVDHPAGKAFTHIGLTNALRAIEAQHASRER